jgi:hypothetical protein
MALLPIKCMEERKKVVEEPLKFVASCKPQVFSIHDFKNPYKQSCQEKFGMPTIF